MSYLVRPFGLFFLLIMILLGFQVALKKPLCINSNLVYKIDKIDVFGSATIYSCNQYKKVNYSNYFDENLPDIQSRILKFEMILANLEIRDKYIIQLDDIHKNQSVELLNGIRIGTKQFQTSEFEKSLLKLALKHRLALQDQVVIETLADFLINDNQYQNLISEAWSDSFKKLSFFDKRKVEKKLFRFLHSDTNWQAKDSIQTLKQLLAVAENPMLSNLFKKNLIKLGYLDQEETQNYKLDVIVDLGESKKEIETELTELAKNNPFLKIALKTSEGLFLLPSQQKVTANLEQKLFTQYRLIWVNKGNQSLIESFSKNTERLVFIQSEPDLRKINFRTLFNKGVIDFLASNKQLEFVQLHVPSYHLKFKELNHIANYFDFVKIKELTMSEHKALGWTQTEWLKDMRAFKPVANYDVIQYFRIN